VGPSSTLGCCIVTRLFPVHPMLQVKEFPQQGDVTTICPSHTVICWILGSSAMINRHLSANSWVSFGDRHPLLKLKQHG
jgi:hypothetical protein